MKVALYGSITVDSIHMLNSDFIMGHPNECYSHTRRTGAIGNVCKAIKRYFPDIDVMCAGLVGNDAVLRDIERIADTNNIVVSNMKTSFATIIVNVKNNTKTSVVHWQACTGLLDLPELHADWHHIAYLDRLYEISPFDLDKLDGVVSVDFCNDAHSDEDRPRLHKFFPYIDYLFASEEEAMSLVEVDDPRVAANMLGRMVRGYAIVHSSTGSFVANGESSVSVRHEEIDGVCVLGLGDAFVAAFIGHHGTVFDKVTFAHRTVIDEL